MAIRITLRPVYLCIDTPKSLIVFLFIKEPINCNPIF